MHCPYCGKEISENAKVCPYCGREQKRKKAQVEKVVEVQPAEAAKPSPLAATSNSEKIIPTLIAYVAGFFIIRYLLSWWLPPVYSFYWFAAAIPWAIAGYIVGTEYKGWIFVLVTVFIGLQVV